MFESILGAVLAHKQIVIAAVAISGLLMYAFPYTMMAANAQIRPPIHIQRDIVIPCQPYCNFGGGGGPQDIHRVAGPVTIDINFHFTPIRALR